VQTWDCDRALVSASPVLQGRDSEPVASSHAGVRWFSTYFRMMSSGAPPQDAAKYEGDQRWAGSVDVRDAKQLRNYGWWLVGKPERIEI